MKQLLDNITGKKTSPKTVFLYKKEDNYLYFSFIAFDSSLNSYSNIKNDALYKGDVIEIFIDLGDEYYYEIEVAPNGTTFVAKILNREIEFIDDSFLNCKSTINGKDYKVDMKIDLSKLKANPTIKFNAFRIETKGIHSEYILQALSPTLCNSFHVRDKFISL